MLFLCDGDRELLSLIEKLLLDTQTRIASTEDIGTSTEVKRADIRLAAKNINEAGKLLISLMTARGPLAPNLGWRFISAQRMYANLKSEVRRWAGKIFGTDNLELSSFHHVYEHIESHYLSSLSGKRCRIMIFFKLSHKWNWQTHKFSFLIFTSW